MRGFAYMGAAEASPRAQHELERRMRLMEVGCPELLDGSPGSSEPSPHEKILATSPRWDVK